MKKIPIEYSYNDIKNYGYYYDDFSDRNNHQKMILHRMVGPALIFPSGNVEWYIHGSNITNEVDNWFKEHNLTYETMNEDDKAALRFYIKLLE